VAGKDLRAWAKVVLTVLCLVPVLLGVYLTTIVAYEKRPFKSSGMAVVMDSGESVSLNFTVSYFQSQSAKYVRLSGIKFVLEMEVVESILMWDRPYIALSFNASGPMNFSELVLNPEHIVIRNQTYQIGDTVGGSYVRIPESEAEELLQEGPYELELNNVGDNPINGTLSSFLYDVRFSRPYFIVGVALAITGPSCLTLLVVYVRRRKKQASSTINDL